MKSDDFERVLQNLLAPLAQAMIAHGVPLNSANQALKAALFDAALQAANDDKKLTDSRISLLTGLHRKDVRQFRKSPGSVPTKRSTLNASSLAIALWTTDTRFLDGKGQPLPLKHLGDGDTPGFDDLVRAARIDLPSATVLDALIAEGAVEKGEQNSSVSLVDSALVPNPKSSAMLEVYEKNLVTHFQIATENLLAKPDQPREFERALHVNQLSEDSIRKLDDLARKLSQSALMQLNKQALEFQNEDRGDGLNNARFSIGIYIASKQHNPPEKPDEENSQ